MHLSHHHPPRAVAVMSHASGGYDSVAAGEDLSLEREQALRAQCQVSSFLPKPAVVEMFSAGQTSSSLITGNNEVFVILKGKEEKRLRIV